MANYYCVPILIGIVILFLIYELSDFMKPIKQDIPNCRIINISNDHKIRHIPYEKTDIPNLQPTKTVLPQQKQGVQRRKFISADFGMTGGIGNDLWKFASIYGIGRTIGREVYWENAYRANRIQEMANIFPIINEVLHIKYPVPFQYIEVNDFGVDCCKYEDPTRLKSINATYLKLHKHNNNYFQAFPFFHEYENEIREIFECSDPIMQKVKKQAKDLFGSEKKDNSTHNMCVHTRRTDFFLDPLLGTDEKGRNFTLPAINFVHNFLQEKGITNISAMFFGDDHGYMRQIKDRIKNLNFFNSHIISSGSRGEDICLANNFCNSMILTASGSTFGWWMTYLMPKGSYVFYNSQVSDSGNFTKDVHDYDLFLPEWIRIVVVNNTAKRESNWWHERNHFSLDHVKKMVFP